MVHLHQLSTGWLARFYAKWSTRLIYWWTIKWTIVNQPLEHRYPNMVDHLVH